MDRIEALVAQAQQRAAELVDGLTHHVEPDGCELDFTDGATPDEDVDGLVLFAGTDPGDVLDLAEAWRILAEGDDSAS
jgi:hypothetical protein